MISLDGLDPELASFLQGLADKLTEIGQEAEGKEIIGNVLKVIELDSCEAATLEGE